MASSQQPAVERISTWDVHMDTSGAHLSCSPTKSSDRAPVTCTFAQVVRSRLWKTS